MNTAKINKETEKAILMQFGCWVNDLCTWVTAWMPKSQITEISRENDIMTFDVKNDWILDAKVKDYVTYLSTSGELAEEHRNYLSAINAEKVEYVFFSTLNALKKK